MDSNNSKYYALNSDRTQGTEGELCIASKNLYMNDNAQIFTNNQDPKT